MAQSALKWEGKVTRGVKENWRTDLGWENRNGKNFWIKSFSEKRQLQREEQRYELGSLLGSPAWKKGSQAIWGRGCFTGAASLRLHLPQAKPDAQMGQSGTWVPSICSRTRLYPGLQDALWEGPQGSPISPRFLLGAR